MDAWQTFFAAEVGASAALLGLLFVSVSINLTKILSFRALPNRAFGALLMMLIVLIVCSLMLTPGQPMRLVGAEILVVGLGFWWRIAGLDLTIWKHTEREYRKRAAALIILDQAAMLLYVAAGLVVIAAGLAGLYLLVPAILLSFAKAALDAWVLLVEINR